MVDVTYKISVQGAKTAQQSLDTVNAKATSHKQSFVQSANNIDNAFKSVSRDIDAVAGKTAATFGAWASDIAGIVAAVGTGGLTGGIAILTAGVGLVAGAWNQWEKETQAQKKAADDAQKAEANWLETTLANVKKVTQSLEKKSAEELRQVVIAHDIHLAEIAEQRTVLNLKLAMVRGDTDERVRIMRALYDNTALAEKTALERSKAYAAIGVENNRQAAIQAREAVGAELAKQEEDRKKKAEEQKKLLHDVTEAVRKDAAEQTRVKTEQAAAIEQLQYHIDVELPKQAADALAFINTQTTGLIVRLKSRQIESEQKHTLAIEEGTRAQKEYAQAVAISTAGEVYGMGVNTAFSVSMFAVGEAVGFATQQLEKFGSINRENYRDMLAITENTKAAFAAEAQAFLFQLGLKAGGQAIFETAAAGQENALAMGSAAILDFRGAGMHLASAGMHSAAAGAYSVIAVGGVGASLAIGLQRGEGGMVGLTQEEQDKKEADRKKSRTEEERWTEEAETSKRKKAFLAGRGGSASGTGGGPSGGSYRGDGERGSESGTTVVNIYNEPGSMSSADEDRAARATAQHVRRAQRDWWAQRAMAG